jgi:NADH-quinone oxidoreductase subunit L/multicomponent Na+:H+ antiporter subunit D
MTAFAVAAAGLVGFPLVAGFVSKFHLVLGAAGSQTPAFVAVYLLAGVLKLLYFWPIVYAAFFGARDGAGPESRHAFAPPHAPAETVGATDGGAVTVATDAVADHSTAGSGGHSAAERPTRVGWERRSLGHEASPFLLGPVLLTVGGAVLLGVVPTALPFWDLAETVVAEVFA